MNTTQQERQIEMEWKKRRRVVQHDCGTSYVRESRDGRYRVRHTGFTLGATPAQVRAARRAGDTGRAAALERARMPDAHHACRLHRYPSGVFSWLVISTHRTEAAAIKAVERYESANPTRKANR